MLTSDARDLLDRYAHAESGAKALFLKAAQAGRPLQRTGVLRGTRLNAQGDLVPHTGPQITLLHRGAVSAHANMAWAAVEQDAKAAFVACLDPFLVLLQQLLPVANGPVAECGFFWVDRVENRARAPEPMLRVNGTWIHNPARTDTVPILSPGRALCFVEHTAHLEPATTRFSGIVQGLQIAAATRMEARVLAHAANPDVRLEEPIEF
jgi:hypothetical protein